MHTIGFDNSRDTYPGHGGALRFRVFPIIILSTIFRMKLRSVGTGFITGAFVTIGNTVLFTTVDTDVYSAGIRSAGIYTRCLYCSGHQSGPDNCIPPAGLTVVSPTPTPTDLPTPTPTVPPTPTPTLIEPTPTPAPFSRPQIVIGKYSLSVDSIRYGQDFNLNMSLTMQVVRRPMGSRYPSPPVDLLMLKNGGVVVAGNSGCGWQGEFQPDDDCGCPVVGGDQGQR